ncbi:MAG: redoxin domain-containing protein [Lutibacter sp.]
MLSTIIYGQEKVITREFTTSRVEQIDYSKIYNKQTGKRIKKKEFYKLIKENPNLPLDRVIGSDGKVIRYLVDLNRKNKLIFNSTLSSKKIMPGELFPNFIAKTIDNRKIELNKFRGKIVILRFEMAANNFRFKKYEIKELDAMINKIENKNEKVKAIIIFRSSISDIKKGFDLPNSNFELIPNGFNYREKYSITSFPTTIVIDKSGKLVDYYRDMEDINLEKLISE